MPSGKCEPCRVRWIWNGRPRASEALCPNCHRALQPTSQNSLLPSLSAYSTNGLVRGGAKYLTADPTEMSKLRRKLKKLEASAPIKREPLSRRKMSA